jgi:hypothetical protein
MRYTVSNAKSRFVSSVSQIKSPYSPVKNNAVQEKSVTRPVTACIVVLFIVGQIFLFYYLYNHHSLFKHSSTSALDEIKSNSFSSSVSNEVVDSATDSILSLEADAAPEEEYRIFPVSITSTHSLFHIKHRSSQDLIMKLLGNKSVTEVDFPDLSYRSKQEVETTFSKIFSEELPKLGFHDDFRNPCWYRTLPAEESVGVEKKEQRELVCLPYAYILGQPKCGTSDLFERLKKHPDIM